MRITDAFLAENASVADGKLYVNGGVLVRSVGNGRRVSEITLVVLTDRVSEADDGEKVAVWVDVESAAARVVTTRVFQSTERRWRFYVIPVPVFTASVDYVAHVGDATVRVTLERESQ